MPKHIASWNQTRGRWVTDRLDLLNALPEPYSETWPNWGMTRSGEAFALPMPELRTADDESSSLAGLLPTPAAMNPNDGEDPERWMARRKYHLTRGIHNTMPLGQVAARLAVGDHSELLEQDRKPERLLPTPEAKLGGSGADYARAGRKDSGGDDLLTALAKMGGGRTPAPSDDGSR